MAEMQRTKETAVLLPVKAKRVRTVARHKVQVRRIEAAVIRADRLEAVVRVEVAVHQV